MAWKETCAMEQRMRFVIAAREEGAVISRVCAAFGVSRQTGHKWLKRFEFEGPVGLVDRSRAPRRHGRSREEELLGDIVALHDLYGWGAKKLRHKLHELRPEIALPAVSTIGDWLAKKGLTKRRRRRRGSAPYARPFSAATQPNAVWCAPISFRPC